MSRAWRGKGAAWRYARDEVIEATGSNGIGIRESADSDRTMENGVDIERERGEEVNSRGSEAGC